MSFTVSINPTYFCNFSCEFCYLTPEQLRDRSTLLVDPIMDRLAQIDKPITHVDLYGGEIGLLPDDYLNNLIDRIKETYNPTVSIITNLSMIRQAFLREDIDLSVSFDFNARERENLVFKNMLSLQRPFNILILASEKLIQNDVDYMINLLNTLSNLESVEIKPYSSNQANNLNVTHKQFEDFVIKWLESPIEKHFDFINQFRIEDCLDDLYNAFSDNHVYITPYGKFAVLEFDEDDNEFFLELDTFDEYKQWAEKEKISLSPICTSCKYFGKCLTEHYRYVKDLDNSCNGYKGLLEYYERMEN